MICVTSGTAKLTAAIGGTLQTGIIHLEQPSNPPPTLPGDFIYVMDLPEMDPPPDQNDYNYFIFQNTTYLNGYLVGGETVAQAIDLTSPSQYPDSNAYQFRFKFRTMGIPALQVNTAYFIRYWDIGQFTPRYVREANPTLSPVSDNIRARFTVNTPSYSRYIEVYSDSTGTVMRVSDGTTDDEVALSYTSGEWYVAVIDVNGTETSFKVYPFDSPEPPGPQFTLTTGDDTTPVLLQVDWAAFLGSVGASAAILELGPIDLCDHGSFGTYPSVVGDITTTPPPIGRITETLTNALQKFRLTNGYQPGSTEVSVNGSLQRPNIDYTESNPPTGEITLGTQASGTITVTYTAAVQAGPSVPPPMGPVPSNVVWYPVAPSTSSDYGGSIHDFIVAQSAAGNTAGFHAGTWRWDARQVFSNSNLRIWADTGAVFQRFAAGGVHEMIQFFRCDGLQIGGNLRLLGPATEAQVIAKNDYYPNEEEYAIALYGGQSMSMSGLQVTNFWSDGIYIVRADDNASGTEPNGLLMQDCDLSICGRQSISVISGRNLTFRRCSGHTLRLHGFDFEPNRDDDVFSNVLFDSCSYTDFDAGLTASGRGFAIAIGGAPGRVQAQNVQIINQFSDTGVKGGTLYVHGPNNGQHHNVTVTGWHGSSGSGDITRVTGWVQSGNSISLPGTGDVN